MDVFSPTRLHRSPSVKEKLSWGWDTSSHRPLPLPHPSFRPVLWEDGQREWARLGTHPCSLIEEPCPLPLPFLPQSGESRLCPAQGHIGMRVRDESRLKVGWFACMSPPLRVFTKNPSVTRILFKNVVDTNGFHFDNGWLGTAKSPTP